MKWTEEKLKERRSCEQNGSGLKKWLVGIFVLIAMVEFAVLLLLPEEENPVLKELHAKNGYIRTVEREEYEFFRKIVYRDALEELTESELEAKTKEKINRANAEFLLGNQMGLCGPYSFESFQIDMENENIQRKLKKENNEVFYGPEEFDLSTYYAYVSSNLKMDMVSFITDHADEKMIKDAKAYFEEHKENYRMIKSVEYFLSENGGTELKTILYEEFSTLEKTDSQLFDFLYSGKAGDELEYVYQEQQRKIEIESVKYEKLTYKNNAERVMRDYITNVYLESWLQEIEENYPVEINF